MNGHRFMANATFFCFFVLLFIATDYSLNNIGNTQFQLLNLIIYSSVNRVKYSLHKLTAIVNVNKHNII